MQTNPEKNRSVMIRVPFECPICPTVLSSKSRFHKHRQQLHLDRKLKCLVCSNRYNTQELLDEHQLVCEPILCDVCGRQYASKKSLKQHYNYHGRRFTCTLCNRVFRCTQHLKRHSSVHSTIYSY